MCVCVCVLFELGCNEIPVQFAHAVFVLGLSFGYLFFCVLTKGFIVSMSHIDLANNGAAVVFTGILVFHLLVYTFVFFASKYKLHMIDNNLKRGEDACVGVRDMRVHVGGDNTQQVSLLQPMLTRS
eukprot:GDKI01017708.1.p1 GENE.GDKI01017708.1~~GDKI01017708.1.p1  ORF type:complete len:126 (-),score=33.17 GDKI01017708.1:36-413(-)